MHSMRAGYPSSLALAVRAKGRGWRGTSGRPEVSLEVEPLVVVRELEGARAPGGRRTEDLHALVIQEVEDVGAHRQAVVEGVAEPEVRHEARRDLPVREEQGAVPPARGEGMGRLV